MVKKINIEEEVEEALQHIKSGNNFVVTGGAGSGKTYSLISLINEYSKKNVNCPIVCITYTNNAVYEIKERINNKNLYISTIHDFLWNIIKQFQDEIKITVAELINSPEERYNIFKTPDINIEIDELFFENQIIGYDENYSINVNDSSISHDHVILLAERMFEKYKKLCDILKDNANLILVDEYQDTRLEVIKILLEHINKSKKKCVIGFFGDPMQSIYDEGVGKIESDKVKHIIKRQNRRNPLSVISVANKLRDDSLIQEASADKNAPNMVQGKIKEGKAIFLYSKKVKGENSYEKLETAKELNDIFKGWNFGDVETKELWLTHSINSQRSGFQELYLLYYKDPIKELITKLKKTSIDKDPNLNFKQLCLDNIKLFNNRNKGNIFNNVQNENKEYLEIVEDMIWDDVKNQIIDSDSLLSYKFDSITNTYKAKTNRDIILRQLDELYELNDLYLNKDANSILKKTSFKVESLSNKSLLSKYLSELNNLINSSTIEQVLDFSLQKRIVTKKDEFSKYIENRGYYLWNRMKKLKFTEYKNSIDYQKENLPFATQHSVKGSEYNNVLVVLDNGNWRKYNFKKTLLNTEEESITSRTRKLLYVCLTRAKKELCVYMNLDLNKPDSHNIINKAKELFGEDSVIEI